VEEIIYFEPESAFLVTEAQVEIARIAAAIADEDVKPELLTAVGHTALFGTAPARLALSEQRAAAVAEELRVRLRELGVTEIEIRERGVGGSAPVTTAQDEQWQNRRVEISSP
jgi:outer membrane protein OmpA-like peptidoglycan-associated protein